MKFNIYSVWLDPVFYIAVVIFAVALFLLVFSIRKYLEIKNKSDFEEADDEAGEVQDELPLAEPPAEESDPRLVSEVLPAPAETPAAGAASASPSRAEEFVKGLYDRLASLDGRVKNIEAALSKSKINRDFTTKFLEDIVTDFDSLDKAKIKARIEYLMADLKK